MGLLFESLVEGTRIYAQPLDGHVSHYQDDSPLEVDAIVQTVDSWGAFEIKLGGEKWIEEAATNLAKFKVGWIPPSQAIRRCWL